MKKIFTIIIALMGLCASTAFAQETEVEINGVTWATRNVGMPGTFVTNPEDAGLFYQWNSKIGWSHIGTPVPSDGTSVWNSDWHGGTAETWEAANDPCPAGWHVASFDDFEKLIATGGEWTTTPVKGVRYGSGENIVFIPAVAGFLYRGDGSLETANLQAIYWTSTSYDSDHAYDFYFYKEGGDEEIDYENAQHSFGFCIRCVKDASETSVPYVSTDAAEITGYYSVIGQRLTQEPTSGVYVIMYSDGKAVKVVK